MDDYGTRGRFLDGPAVAQLVADRHTPMPPMRQDTAAELARVLSVAAAPELTAEPVAPVLTTTATAAAAAEERALAAFRAAVRDSPAVPAARQGAALRRAVRRLGSIRTTVIAVLVSALLGGGIAFAGGGLPRPGPLDRDTSSGRSDTKGGTPSAEGTAAGQTGRGIAPRDRSGSPGPRASGASAVTSPDELRKAEELCRPYLLLSEGRQREKAVERGAFQKLLAAAGGIGEVDAYCEPFARDGGDQGASDGKGGKGRGAFNDDRGDAEEDPRPSAEQDEPGNTTSPEASPEESAPPDGSDETSRPGDQGDSGGGEGDTNRTAGTQQSATSQPS